MTWYAENSCNVRAVSGMDCARKFGRLYAEKFARIPSNSEILSHIPGGNSYTAPHKDNMCKAARNMAVHHLGKIQEARRRILSECIPPFLDIFREMGFDLEVVFSTADCAWVLEASFRGSRLAEDSLASLNHYPVRVSISPPQGASYSEMMTAPTRLFCKLAGIAEEANRDSEAKTA